VSFIWGNDSQYLEYEASWGFAGDQTHRRLWADGRIEELDAMNKFAVAPIDADVAAAIAETGNYNRGIEQALITRGLLPRPEISRRHEAWSARRLWSSLDLTPDALLALATEVAAGMIDSVFPRPSFLESKIETALLAAIGDRVDPDLLGAREREFEIPDWSGDLRGIDLYIRARPAGSASAASSRSTTCSGGSGTCSSWSTHFPSRPSMRPSSSSQPRVTGGGQIDPTPLSSTSRQEQR
jgi:hypothetical protein